MAGAASAVMPYSWHLTDAGRSGPTVFRFCLYLLVTLQDGVSLMATCESPAASGHSSSQASLLHAYWPDTAKYLVLTGYFLVLSAAYFLVGSRGLFNLQMYAFQFDVERCILAVAFLYLVAFALPSRTNKVSDYFLWLHAAVPIVPTLVFFAFSGGSIPFLGLAIGAFIGIRLLTLPGAILAIPGVSTSSPERAVWIGIFILYVLIIAGGDYSSIDFSPENIYLNRAQIAESQSSYFEYLHTNLAKALLPFLLVFYYARSRWFPFLATLICSLGVFLVSQHRAALFFPLLALLCFAATRRSKRAGGGNLVAMLTVVLTIGMIFTLSDMTLLLGDIIIRRTFIVPAALNFEYFSFFNNNPFTLFSDSKLSFGLLSRVYQEQIPYLIGYQIGLPGAHANSSYLGSGYQQAGVVGVLLYVLVISATLHVLDGIGNRMSNHCFVFAVCSPSLFWLIDSSDLPSVYLTHGLILATAILWYWAGYLRLYFAGLDSTSETPKTRPINPPAAR